MSVMFRSVEDRSHKRKAVDDTSLNFFVFTDLLIS
jgi:hypothetical protein